MVHSSEGSSEKLNTETVNETSWQGSGKPTKHGKYPGVSRELFLPYF